MSFSTDKARARELLHTPILKPFSDYDRVFMQYFFNTYHNTCFNIKINKIITRIAMAAGAMKEQTNMYITGSLHGELVKNKMISINNTSANPFLKRKDYLANIESESSILKALRFSVGEYHNSVKTELLLDNGTCSICGKSLDTLTRDEIHLDHCGDYEFRQIANLFIESVKFTNDTFEIIHMLHGKDLAPGVIRDQWVEFHNSVAKYQLTCSACNLSKAKK